jgi:2-haloacid dehalogenase
MAATLAFDVYGTLIDPLGISVRLEKVIGEKAAAFTKTWREKQIEYLFRRALGRDYQPFSVCTAQALDYTALGFDVSLSKEDRQSLLAAYRELPAYEDVPVALRNLKDAGYRSYAFSNGEPADLAYLLGYAGVDAVLDGIVSVHDIQSYKPDPDVYAHFLASAGSKNNETWLVSGNPFDVIGAHRAGWLTAWVRRNPAILFDPWGIEPTISVSGMAELVAALAKVDFKG